MMFFFLIKALLIKHRINIQNWFINIFSNSIVTFHYCFSKVDSEMLLTEIPQLTSFVSFMRNLIGYLFLSIFPVVIVRPLGCVPLAQCNNSFGSLLRSLHQVRVLFLYVLD